MELNINIISSKNYKILTKNINSEIDKSHQKEFIKTIASDFGYKITSKTLCKLLYNIHLGQYEIILFESPKEDFVLEDELFLKAFELFDIPKSGYRVFIYQNSIFIFQDGDSIFFKTFENDFNIDELSDFITRHYGIEQFEFTYIKQKQYDLLAQEEMPKSTHTYITLHNTYEMRILFVFMLVVLLAIGYILYLLFSDDVPIEQNMIVEEPQIANIETIEKESYSKTLNTFFANLNEVNIILESLSIENSTLKATLVSENKEKLFSFASKYDDNLTIKKIIYDTLTNKHIMEIEFAIQGGGVL
jgi:hypothetical protein